MTWIMVEYLCEDCGARFESLEERGSVPDSKQCHAFVGMTFEEVNHADGIERIETPQTCGGTAMRVPAVGYMMTVNKKNSDYASRQRERLQKRADDHWRKVGCDEAIDRSRAKAKRDGA
jgi:hypothetical protein